MVEVNLDVALSCLVPLFPAAPLGLVRFLASAAETALSSRRCQDWRRFARVLSVQKVLSGSGRAGRLRLMGKYIGHSLCYTLYFFKVAFSTFWFKFGATLRRQAERRDSGTRQKASNLAQPIS